MQLSAWIVPFQIWNKGGWKGGEGCEFLKLFPINQRTK